ncbi:MAG: hypothetical protein KAQ92_08325, partial [Candidatus Aenigmarchaeota archaeon]|nr:hypothetical protein [Candidatus Aenigmarchaeota archaeon]
IKNYYHKIYQESKEFSSAMSNQENSLELVKEKIALLDRLNKQKLIDKISHLNQKEDLINQKMELEKVKINNDANKYKLKILRTPEEKICKQD